MVKCSPRTSGSQLPIFFGFFLQAFGSLFFLVTSWYVVDDKLAADRAILSEIEAEESDEDDEDDDEDDDSDDEDEYDDENDDIDDDNDEADNVDREDRDDDDVIQ